MIGEPPEEAVHASVTGPAATLAPAAGLVIVAVVFVVNLRHALYSASIAPHVRHLGPVWKATLAYLHRERDGYFDNDLAGDEE